MTPGSPEWNCLVTASKVAAILGVSPWESPRSMWHRMHGDLPAEEQTTAQGRGHYLEPAILAWWQDRHSARMPLLTYQPEFKLGDWGAATPDARAVFADDATFALVEAKSTNSLDDWGQPGTDEIPTYYLLQCMWQMHVSGIHRCYVPIIGPRLEFAEYVVDYDPAGCAALERTVRKFYDSLAADEPPPLDDTTATYEAVRRVHAEIDPDAAVELTKAEAIEFLESVTDLESSEARARRLKSGVLDRMGNANYAVCEGIKVARRQRGKGGVSFYPLPKNLPLLDLPTEMTA